MPHIEINNPNPGIIGLLTGFKKSGQALSQLAQTLLVEESPLTRAERETIATYVSRLNGCEFCMRSHGAAAEALTREAGTPDMARAAKLEMLLAVASEVQKSGSPKTDESIRRAKKAGATDREIHDTVLIAAAFCMFNRYVDGLGTVKPGDDFYVACGERLSKQGYVEG